MLTTAFLVLGCIAFSLFILWALGRAAGQVRPALWVVLAVLVVLAANVGQSGTFAEPTPPKEPAPCTLRCADQFSAPEDIEQRRACDDLCREARVTP